jgi:predicted RNase H-like HicB family nuclease
MTSGNFQSGNDLIYARPLIIVSTMNGLSEYCKAALELAVVKNLGADEGHFAKFPDLPVWWFSRPPMPKSFVNRPIRELKSALEGWVELSLERGDGLPALHDLEIAT